jgi:hypothetical protein
MTAAGRGVTGVAEGNADCEAEARVVAGVEIATLVAGMMADGVTL